MSDFSKFDELVDLDALREEVQRAADGNGDFEEVPTGMYEVSLEKMELKESKKGQPMVSVWFRIIAGDYTGQMLFMNQVITKPFQIHICNQFLKSLKTGFEISFNSYSDYGSLIEDVYSEAGKHEYALDYGEKNGYKTFTITEVFTN